MKMVMGGKGFTITEVLIFLAVSGAMFTIAFFGLRGQQDSVAFRQSLDGIEQKIREVFNNVDNGYFGNAGQYQCVLVLNGTTPSITPAPANAPGGGNSDDCIFIGKAISFNDKQMSIVTRIGSRLGVIETEPDLLKETYTINNDVSFLKARICENSDCEIYDEVTSLRVGAQRDRNDAGGDIQADLRAQRKYQYDAGGSTTAWISVTSNNQPMYCFELGDDRIGSITIVQKDIKIDYNGVGCK